MAARVEAAGAEAQLALLRAHPDLAGKLAMRGELTVESTSEQAGAGLDRCSLEEFEEESIPTMEVEEEIPAEADVPMMEVEEDLPEEDAPMMEVEEELPAEALEPTVEVEEEPEPEPVATDTSAD